MHKFQGRISISLILCTFGLADFLVIPNSLIIDLIPYPSVNDTQWWELYMEMPTGENISSSAILIFLIYPLLGRIIPICLISFLGGLLRTLWKTDKRGRKLKNYSTNVSYGKRHSIPNVSAMSNSLRQNRRTTIMLLTIIVMYVISEVAQALLVIFCVEVDGSFGSLCIPFSDFIDLFALINSAINFGMYCTMS